MVRFAVYFASLQWFCSTFEVFEDRAVVELAVSRAYWLGDTVDEVIHWYEDPTDQLELVHYSLGLPPIASEVFRVAAINSVESYRTK